MERLKSPVAWYTHNIMVSLHIHGRAVEYVGPTNSSQKLIQRARSRLRNAADRLGVAIETHVYNEDGVSYVEGLVV